MKNEASFNVLNNNTLASGSSSSAAAGATYKLGLVDNKVTVHMPGGSLLIEIDENYDVTMTGRVSYVGRMELGLEFIEENNIFTN